MLVNKDTLIGDARLLAAREAKRREMDEIDEQSLAEEAADLIEDCFRALETRGRGENFKEGKKLETWSERSFDEICRDSENILISTSCLSDYAAQYSRMDWLRIGQLDWLLINAICYGHLLKIVPRLEKLYIGRLHYRLLVSATFLQSLQSGALSLIWLTTKFILWTAAAVAAFLYDPILVIPLTLFFVYRSWLSVEKMKEYNRIRRSAINLWAVASGDDYSWRQLDFAIKEMSHFTAMEPGIWRLVSKRLSEE